MATAEYIGALISLVSKSDIRYQGLLASINPNEATIALERVRSWGTEGRRSAQGKSQEEIPPSDHVYDYIMFRAADVKDLKIDDPNPPKQQRPAPQPVLNDPAILNVSVVIECKTTLRLQHGDRRQRDELFTDVKLSFATCHLSESAKPCGCFRCLPTDLSGPSSVSWEHLFACVLKHACTCTDSDFFEPIFVVARPSRRHSS